MKHRKPQQHEPSNSTLCQIIWQLLTMNNFDFNGKHYRSLQVAGTAMGTRVASTYANMFMVDFEDTHVYKYHKQPTLWLRFIDAIFVKFTSEISSEKVSFLDTLISVTTDGLSNRSVYQTHRFEQLPTLYLGPSEARY